MAKEEKSPTKVQEPAVDSAEGEKDLKCELKSKTAETPAETKETTNGEQKSAVDKVNGSAEDPEKKPEEKYHESPTKNEAYVLLAQGKRHYLVKDYTSAVATLGDCCAKFSEIFGETADECGDVYFSYGKALLELAREESGVLGSAIEKDKEDESDDDDEEEEDEAGETEEGETEKMETQENADAEKKENGTASDAKGDSEGKGETAEGGAGDGDEGKEPEEEDVNNLQLAWEILELARSIYERQQSNEKLADTLSKLGEVSLETENYEQAIEDMSKSLDLQRKILSEDNRGIAETYFQLGVACSLANSHDDSISHFKKAKEVLELRIKNLKTKTEPDPENQANAFYSIEGEIKEIEAILPEIDEKIADMEDFKAETLKALSSSIVSGKAKEGESSSSTFSASAESAKPATNISHLIRKKRKPDEAAEGSECKIKKVAPEVSDNEKNETAANGTKTSDSEMKEVESKSA